MLRLKFHLVLALVVPVGLSLAASAAEDVAAHSAPATSATPTADPSLDLASPAVTLKYRYAKGQRLDYVVVDETTLDVDAGTGQVTMSYSTETWKHLDVQSVSDGGRAVMQLTLDRVKMSAAGPHGQAAFDSQQPGVPPAEFTGVLDRVGRPTIEMTVDSSGRVTGLQEPGRPATRETTLPTELLERDNSGPVVLPNDPIRVGESWTEQVQVPVQVDEGRLKQRVTLRRKYTLTSVADQIATIELDTIVLTPITDPAISAQLIQRTPSGIILFDLQQGQVVSKRTFLNNQVVGHEGASTRLKVVRSYVETLANHAATGAEAADKSVSSLR